MSGGSVGGSSSTEKMKDKSLEVDGALIVYAFDADRHDPAMQKPEKKFVFTAQQLQRPPQPVADGALVQFLAAVG